jgi:hypothetical protein
MFPVGCRIGGFSFNDPNEEQCSAFLQSETVETLKTKLFSTPVPANNSFLYFPTKEKHRCKFVFRRDVDGAYCYQGMPEGCSNYRRSERNPFMLA